MVVEMCVCELKHSSIIKASSNSEKFFSSWYIFTIKWKQNTSDPDTLHGTAFTGLSTLDAWELVYGYMAPNCVVFRPELSTRYVTVHIITHFYPVSDATVWKVSLAAEGFS